MKPTVKELLKIEMEEMAARYGRASMTVEAAYFHVGRATWTLDTLLLASPKVPDDRMQERLVHLAAVCMRFALALNGEETG